MKPLQRYEMNESGCDIPVSDGDWVKWEDVKKLEEQMGHLLDLSKTLLQNIEPDKFTNGVGLSVVMITREMWDDFQKLIADIEGNKE
jgi:hypothetical protein